MGAKKKYNMEFFKKLYISGEKSLKAIVRDYGVSYQHLAFHSADEGWTSMKKEYAAKCEVAEHAAEIKKMDEDLRDMIEAEPLKPVEHQKRTLQTGDRLGTLIQTGVQAVKSGDWRTLKSATETWKIWDEQMRKNHGLEDNVEQPLVNISVLTALPPKSEMLRAGDNEVAALTSDGEEATPVVEVSLSGSSPVAAQ